MHNRKTVQTASNRTVVERNPAGGGEANQLRQSEITCEYVHMPSHATLLHPLSQPWVQFVQFILGCQADTVWRVHHDDAALRRGDDGKNVLLVERNVRSHIRMIDVLSSNLNGLSVPVGRPDADGTAQQLFRLRVRSNRCPEPSIKARQLLKAERAAQPWSHLPRKHCGFDRNRAA